MTGKGSTVYADSFHGHVLRKYGNTLWAWRALIKWRTIGTLVDYVDKDFETYVQGRGKLSRHCTSPSKMESIITKSRMKSQGNCELVEEFEEEIKKERLTIDHFIRVWFTRTRLFL